MNEVEKHTAGDAKNQTSASALAYVMAIFLILSLGILVYWNSLRAPFVIDDFYTILRISPLRNLTRIGEIVSQNLFASAGLTTSYFRPLTQLTFALDYQLWASNPAGYRLTNIALHLINGALVFFLAQRWFSLWPASLVSLLFIVHPVNVQAIAYISSRSDPLVFFFAALTLYLWMTEKTNLRPLCWLSFLLALFSKEPAVVTPVFVLLIDLIRSQSLAEAKETLLRKWPWYLGFAMAFLVYLAIRIWLLGYPLLMETEGGGALLTVWERLLFAAKLLGKYLLLLVFPADLAFEHTVSLPQGISDEVIGPVLFIILMGYLGGKLWHREKIVALGLGWFLIGILPVLNLTLLNLPMMESWLYLPEVGFFIMTVALGQTIFQRKAFSVAMSCLVVIVLSMRTIVRCADWADPIRLFKKNVSLYPDAYLAWSGLGAAYYRADQQKERLDAYQKALALRPDLWDAHLTLAVHYLFTDEDDKASEEFLAALGLKPDSAWASYFLGILKFRSGQWDEALESFRSALSGKPHIPMLYHVIGSTQFALGRDKAAEEALQRALQDSPSRPDYHAGIHIELGRLLKERGNVQSAKREFELAVRFHPGSSQAKEELALLQKEGRKIQSRKNN